MFISFVHSSMLIYATVCLVRYFTCTPLYGLFAPISKVSAARVGAAASGSSTAAASLAPHSRTTSSSMLAKRPTHAVPMSSSVTPLQERSVSRESLSSMSSVTSSASRSRVRLGVTSITKQVVVC